MEIERLFKGESPHFAPGRGTCSQKECMKSGAGGLFWKQQMGMLFTGVRDHLDLLKVGLKDAPNGAVSQLYQQVSLPVLGLFF